MSVRVRFAPSPTGPLHIGGLRTALYCYLFAKKMGGKMLLRIEDTDQTRFVPGTEAYIEESLEWVGIHIDEGVKQGGPHAPYKQSERKEIYHKYVQQLLDSDWAYYAFDTPEELDALKKRLEEAKVDNLSYNAVSRLQMKNSLTLSKEEVEKRLAAGEPYVVRIKVPIKEEIRFKDIVRDWVNVHSSVMDDKILMKSDGMPTYHLANVVDDHLMEITHVIRGEEWLPSAPLHMLLYKAFDWAPPQFAHLPLLLKPEGNGKLSKRDGILGNFPIFPLRWTDPNTGEVSRGFREDGYFPETLINFISLLGWNPGGDQEIMSIEEIIQHFDLDRIHKAGARFDIHKAKWFNQHYIKSKTDEELIELIEPLMLDNAHMSGYVVKLMKERVTFVPEMLSQLPYLFESPNSYDTEIAEKKWDVLAKTAMPIVISSLDKVESFTSSHLHDQLFADLEAADIKPGKIMQALRLAICGEGKGPDLMLTIEALGKTETISRIKKALEVLGS
jgi:glutamyl-tRNA synthetase